MSSSTSSPSARATSSGYGAEARTCTSPHQAGSLYIVHAGLIPHARAVPVFVSAVPLSNLSLVVGTLFTRAASIAVGLAYFEMWETRVAHRGIQIERVYRPYLTGLEAAVFYRRVLVT
jgi:hypothetical protein